MIPNVNNEAIASIQSGDRANSVNITQSGMFFVNLLYLTLLQAYQVQVFKLKDF